MQFWPQIIYAQADCLWFSAATASQEILIKRFRQNMISYSWASLMEFVELLMILILIQFAETIEIDTTANQFD